MCALKKAYLELTNCCNLICDFCPGTKRAPGFLSLEQFQHLTRKLRPHITYLYFHLMGEPLLHPQLEEFLSCAGEQGFRVMITTNGTLFAQKGHLLTKSPAVHKVSISLHSFEGNPQRDTLLTDYLECCISFAKQAANTGKHCELRLWNLDGDTTQGANRQNHQILARLEQHFPQPWKQTSRGISLSDYIYLAWGEKFQWPDLSIQSSEIPVFCYGLRDQIGILWDGTVVPCCLDHEGDIPLGNLLEQSLEEILASPRAKAIYDGFSCRKAVEPLCKTCGYAYTRFSPQKISD